jgi:hypothetical protein
MNTQTRAQTDSVQSDRRFANFLWCLVILLAYTVGLKTNTVRSWLLPPRPLPPVDTKAKEQTIPLYFKAKLHTTPPLYYFAAERGWVTVVDESTWKSFRQGQPFTAVWTRFEYATK